MPVFNVCVYVRLFRVREDRNSVGMYDLVPFSNVASNRKFDIDNLDKKLKKIVADLFVDGDCFVINNESNFDKKGNILIDIDTFVDGKYRFIIPDIRDNIATMVDAPIYCVMIDFDSMEYFWVVAERVRTEFRD